MAATNRFQPHLGIPGDGHAAAGRADAAWLLVDPDGRLVYASPAARTTLDLQGDAVLSPQLVSLAEEARNTGACVAGDAARALAESDGSVVITLGDPATDAAVDLDLQHAAQLRNLARVYMGVVHDLRAPVNAITLNLELIKRALASDEDGDERELARRRQWAQVIGEELERLARSLDLVLTQAEPAASTHVTFDVGELLFGIERLIAAQARQRRVKLELRVPHGALRLSGDRDAIRQAVIGLAVNALEATPEGGRLTLAVTEQDGTVRLTVADTGPGLPDVIRERPFVRRAGRKGGTSLGLYVASRIAASQQGTLRLVESGPSGTTFEFEFPAWSSPAPA